MGKKKSLGKLVLQDYHCLCSYGEEAIGVEEHILVLELTLLHCIQEQKSLKIVHLCFSYELGKFR